MEKDINNFSKKSIPTIKNLNMESKIPFKKKINLKIENVSEKINNIFMKENYNLKMNNSKEKNIVQKDLIKQNIDNNNNEKEKKKMKNEKIKLLIDNISSENNLMNSVNIHNINLINSMNNITFFDSFHKGKIKEDIKDIKIKI